MVGKRQARVVTRAGLSYQRKRAEHLAWRRDAHWPLPKKTCLAAALALGRESGIETASRHDLGRSCDMPRRLTVSRRRHPRTPWPGRCMQRREVCREGSASTVFALACANLTELHNLLRRLRDCGPIGAREGGARTDETVVTSSRHADARWHCPCSSRVAGEPSCEVS
jgi:hypothetical protein